MKNRICILVLSTIGASWLYAQKIEEEMVHFAYDSYELNEQEDRELENFIDQLEVEDLKSIQIVGHTDSDGSNAYNKRLSENRAKTVLKKFLDAQIEQKKIQIDFEGEDRPIDHNNNDTGKQKNRRVEILVTYFDFKIPEAFKVQPFVYRVHPLYDTVLQIGKADSKMTILKNSFIDQHGNLIQDTVDLYFYEYRNAAEILFSGIPMTVKENGEEMVMSSGGMFDIQAKYQDERILMSEDKNLKIDYALTDPDPNMKFYKLDPNNGWKVSQTVTIPSSAVDYFPREKLERIIDFGSVITYKEVYASENRLQRVKKREDRILNRFDRKIDRIKTKSNFIKRQNKRIKIQKRHVRKIERLQRRAMLLNCESRGALVILSNSYENRPDIMNGLAIENFGKYNCDLAYRLPHKAEITAKYVDENGNELEDLAFLSMVDPHYNGALSFSNPNFFMCNKKSKNILALFTKEGKLYICDGNAFQKIGIKSSGEYTIPMKDMTNELRSTEDLAKFLGIRT